MLDWFFSQGFQSFCLVSIGAITGSVFRFFSLGYLSSVFRYKYLGTLIVNLVASFFLGLGLSFQFNSAIASISVPPIILFFCVGFLGSLSTFSAFIIELIDILLAYKLRQFILFSLISLFGGLLAVLAGLLLGGV